MRERATLEKETTLRGNTATETQSINLLLVSSSPIRASLLRTLLEQRGLCGEIHRIIPGRGAVDGICGRGKNRFEPPPDMAMLDFGEPNPACVAVAKQLALESASPRPPLILLTSEASEQLLSAGDLPFDASKIFAPTSLESFADNMLKHPRSRFLHALAVLATLGPILVRLPEPDTCKPGRGLALSA